MTHAHPDHGHDNDHAHDHDHSHVPAVTGANERKILISFVLIFTFMVIEFVGGILSGSLALIADAGHMLTDAVALALAYTAFRLGRRLADSKRTFGYLRFEVLAGFINAITLFGIVAWIVYEAWERLNAPHEVLAGPMFLVAVAGLLINILVLWIMTRGETEHVNVKGAILHVMGDLLGSVGAILAAIIIYYTGWMPIDPILSVLVSLLILRSAWKLLGKSVHILLEGAPDNADPGQIENHLKTQVEGVARIGHVHVWQITSGRSMATVHVQPVNDNEARAVAQRVESELKARFNIEHVTVAIDWPGDTPSPCSFRPAANGNGEAGHASQGDLAHQGHAH